MKPSLPSFQKNRMAPVLREKKVSQNPIQKAAQGMEALFLTKLLAQMRKTTSFGKNPFGFDSQAVKLYQSLLDQELAKKMARAGGIGLSRLIVDYLQKRSYPKRGVPHENSKQTHFIK